MSAAAIHNEYNSIANLIYFPSAVAAHILFGTVLYLLYTGNKRPGLRLMSLTFAAMSFSVFWVAGYPRFAFTEVAFLVLFLCSVYELLRPLTAWGLGKGRPLWVRRVGYLALAWAWIYPHHIPWWAAVFGAPLGVLPSPTLLALVAMLWLAFPQTNRLLHWAAAGLGILYGLFGVVFVHIPSDIILVAVSGLSMRELIQSSRKAGGFLEEDLTPREQPQSFSKQTKKDQVWRI